MYMCKYRQKKIKDLNISTNLPARHVVKDRRLTEHGFMYLTESLDFWNHPWIKDYYPLTCSGKS